MSNFKNFLFVVLIAPGFITGCTDLQPVKSEPDPRIDQLISAMDRCLVSQSETSAELRGQAQRLDLQSQHLASLGQQLGEAGDSSKVEEMPAVAACPKPETVSLKQVVGLLEEVWLPDLGLALTARMDTGISSASLDAQNIEQFERDGKPWVRFEIHDPESGKPLKYERKLKRIVGVTPSGSTEAERRPIIKLGIVIGQINHTAEFVLSERAHKTYQLNIGRDILQDVMVVDVSEKNVAPYVLPDDQAEGKGKTP